MLVRERCRVPAPTEVGRGAPRAVRDCGDCPGPAQSRGVGLAIERGCLLGKDLNNLPPGEGGQSALPGSSALCRNFEVWQGLVAGVHPGPGRKRGL